LTDERAAVLRVIAARIAALARAARHDIERAAQALPAGVVAGRAPQRGLQKRPGAASERRSCQKCKERFVLGAGDLKSTGPRRSDRAGSKQVNLNAFGLHQNNPNGETFYNLAMYST